MVCSSLEIAVYPTQDLELVHRLCSHPEVYPHIIDDGCPQNSADWHIHYDSRRIYLVPYHIRDDRPPTPMGVIAFFPMNFVLYEGHIFLLPEYRGQVSVEIVHKTNQWLFDNTTAQKIIGFVPVTRIAVKKLMEKCAFKEEGFCPKSVLLNGQLVDQYILGIGRDDYGHGRWRR